MVMDTCWPLDGPSANLWLGKSLAGVLAAPDPRAEGASRRVAIDCERVSIRRRYCGIDMRLAVPIAAYQGVTLARTSAADVTGFEVRLSHRDPDLSVTLCLGDQAEIVTKWRSWAQLLALPALVGPGVRRQHQCVRRRGSPLSRRRPRFLIRCKVGRFGETAIVHRNEREIIAYE
ncbi:MAG: hypothetical protein JO366_09470 [Methylobacteriaceae bacterium]|nr:hypothetical protein [Methylobacteriaceae bacterium]